MGSLKRIALAVLVLSSAVVVVTSPAFATPRLTTSTGTRPDNGAVSPFLSPIGDTLANSLTVTTLVAAGSRRGVSFSWTTFALVSQAATCIKVTASGEVVPTHTRIALYSLDFLGCREDAGGSRIDFAFNHISSSNPFYIHLTTNNGGGSGTAVLEIPPGSSIDWFFKSGALDICQMRIQPQSMLGGTLTDGSVSRIRSIALAPGRTVDFSLPIAFGRGFCPDPRFRMNLLAVTGLAYTFDGPVANTPTIQTTSRLP